LRTIEPEILKAKLNGTEIPGMKFSLSLTLLVIVFVIYQGIKSLSVRKTSFFTVVAFVELASDFLLLFSSSTDCRIEHKH